MHWGVGFFSSCYLAAGLHNGGVVASSEMAADFLKAVSGQVSGQIHTYLARFGDALTSLFALQVCKAHVEMVGNDVDDVCYTYVFYGCLDLTFQGDLS